MPSGMVGGESLLTMSQSGTEHITSIMILIAYYQSAEADHQRIPLLKKGRAYPRGPLPILAAPRYGMMISMEMIQITTEEISFLTV